MEGRMAVGGCRAEGGCRAKGRMAAGGHRAEGGCRMEGRMAVGGCRAKGRMATDGHRAAGRMAADGMAVDGQVVALHLLRRKQHLGWSPRQPMCQRCRPQRFAVETHPSRPSVADLALEPLPVELPPAEPLLY